MGLINCASRGLAIRFKGRASHAAEPELALSPVGLFGEIISMLESLGRGGPLDAGFRLATVTHVNAGEQSFGITPGDGEIWVTLRASSDDGVDYMEAAARREIDILARQNRLRADFSRHDRRLDQ